MDLNKFILDEIAGPSGSVLESSSSDEEFLYTPNRNSATRILNYMDTINSYSDTEFKSHFRISRPISLLLINMYKPMHNKIQGGWKPVTPEKAIYMMLWYLSNSVTFRQIADRFNVTLSCAHYTIRKVCKSLVENGGEFIKWPTEQTCSSMSKLFQEKKGLKNIIGAIDGCHIKIKRPISQDMDYINRKGFHSLILQGVVDANGKFIDVMVGEPGSMHDARVLSKSRLFKTATENINSLFYKQYCLLGDSAYPSTSWLVTPFKDDGHLTDEKRQFNYRHSATRIIVEHAFGQLKGRFRRLRFFDNDDIFFIIDLIMAAIILHNICKENNDSDAEEFVENMPQENTIDIGIENTRDAMFMNMLRNN